MRITWMGQFSRAGTTGCPVIDPVLQAINVPARKSLRAHLTFTVPTACTAKQLTVTTQLTDAKGGALAHNSAVLHIVQKRVGQSA